MEKQIFFGLNGKELFKIFAGSLLFVISVKCFVTPAHIYNSGFMGVSQLINDGLHNAGIINNANMAGYINFMFNLPLYFLAYRYISKKFLVGTILSIIIQTIGVSMIPDLTVPLLTDQLASILLGAVIGGYGAGLVLQANCSAGGTEVLGVYTTIKFKISPGTLSMIFNACVYVVCAITMSLETAILSVLFIIIFSISMDRTYIQNIEVSLMIFTEKEEIKEIILKEFKRGVTYWNGKGAYTGNDKQVLMVVLSKYEVKSVRKRIKQVDPNAFIILNDSMEVHGGYEKRLVV